MHSVCSNIHYEKETIYCRYLYIFAVAWMPILKKKKKNDTLICDMLFFYILSWFVVHL